MVEAIVSYVSEHGVSTVSMDDGRVNALSPEMLAEVNSALDRAAEEAAVLVLTGRSGVFSAGFDLTTLREGGSTAREMVKGGLELAERLLSFPSPVVMACTGHAVAMGVFLLLSGDYRIGAAGPYRITANEVQIGLTMPYTAIEICRQRLSPAAVTRAVVLADVFTPEDAVQAGILDRVVPADDLGAATTSAAATFQGLDARAHRHTKERVREATLHAVRTALERDAEELSQMMS